MGSGDVQEDWDDYVETLDEMGLEDVLEVMNAAYTRQNS